MPLIAQQVLFILTPIKELGLQPLQSVGRLSANRASKLLYSMRDKLKEYFMMPCGKTPWHDNVLDEGRDGCFD